MNKNERALLKGMKRRVVNRKVTVKVNNFRAMRRNWTVAGLKD